MLVWTASFQYAGINIGPVHKKDIMKASIMLEHDPQWVQAIYLTLAQDSPVF